MATVNILVAVNVANAVTESTNNGQNVGNYVYMMDDVIVDDINKPNTTEGTDELLTYCNDGDTLRWTIYSIDPDQNVKITGITGDIVQKLDFKPSADNNAQTVWSGIVHGTGDNVQYSLQLLLNNHTPGYFDPHVTSTYATPAKR
ncbi:hypothetical protein [Burkholderia ubonensis]|uniref:Inclusion body protein n=1 Tax=Burkholderia ubonensis TaxID=101571 RepID=A0A107FMI0_9BURK|nr:hypothetical protein [Burkholderia ubonensis]AOK62307.1 hypothetical protein WM29_24700 [Burkholderia ubonensis]KVS51070.1 hypothetical protein WK38_12325 [Burkholderia ubonensis]KVS76076.1 hypothetical protein WK42_17970 [Burkholderia ubonensis]KVS78314.1 hypothetical protein WK43_02210 [Burkholderia ubonensis]KVS82218.1 hypothetical protein WK44_25035 [Burkholderia ubonensis]